MSGQAWCGVRSPLEISTGTPWPSLSQARRRVPSTEVTDRYPKRPPCLMVPTCLIDRRWREVAAIVLDLAIPLGEKPGNSATFGFDCPDEGQAATICQPRRR